MHRKPTNIMHMDCNDDLRKQGFTVLSGCIQNDSRIGVGAQSTLEGKTFLPQKYV